MQCPVCLETLENPRTLPCNHSLCKVCLYKIFERKLKEKDKRPDVTFNCPVCYYELPFDEKDIEKITGAGSHFVRNLLGILAEEHRDQVVACNHCEQPSVARCLGCNVFTCDACLKVHHNTSDGLDHHVTLSTDEVPKPKSRSKMNVQRCKEREDEILKYVCDTCPQPFCGDW